MELRAGQRRGGEGWSRGSSRNIGMEVGNEGGGQCPGIGIGGFILSPLPPPTAGAASTCQGIGIMVKHFIWIILFNAHNNPVRKTLLL